VIGRKDDPAFLYFPANYRWSMGLLICLNAAPWTGVEVDEVHRVARLRITSAMTRPGSKNGPAWAIKSRRAVATRRRTGIS